MTPTAPPAPLHLRLGAACVDAAVITALVAMAATGGAVAFGTEEIGRHLARGFDYVLDGLLLRRHVAVLLLAFGAVAFTAYSTVCHALFGQTLGKRLSGIRVITRDGENPGFGDSLWRAIANVLFFSLAGVGLAWLLVDFSRHALHDRLVGTRVERDTAGLDEVLDDDDDGFEGEDLDLGEFDDVSPATT